MPYVIFNKQTNKYIKHPSTWVGRLSKATKFKTEESVLVRQACFTAEILRLRGFKVRPGDIGCSSQN